MLKGKKGNIEKVITGNFNWHFIKIHNIVKIYKISSQVDFDHKVKVKPHSDFRLVTLSHTNLNQQNYCSYNGGWPHNTYILKMFRLFLNDTKLLAMCRSHV